MYGEFNLFAEGEALDSFALTSIGLHPKFRVVQVKHHSPKCLIEEIADGPTVAKALEQVGDAPSPRKDAILELLREYHLAVFNAFARDGLIHSDIHLGNAVLETAPDTGTLRFALFDVGYGTALPHRHIFNSATYVYYIYPMLCADVRNSDGIAQPEGSTKESIGQTRLHCSGH